MNYLAHAVLAGPDPLMMLGNWLGDAVKGPLPGGLCDALAAGVSAHREIDRQADRHPKFVESRQRLFAGFSHYAGVIVDVVYDHVLASGWDRYVEEPFDAFVDRCYARFTEHEHALPTPMADRGRGLVANDVFRRYRTEDGLREALRRMTPRLRRRVALEDAVDLVRDHRTAFATEFAAVFESLRKTAS